MVDIKRLTFAGNVGFLYRDDGSIVKMLASTTNQWVPDGGNEFPIPPSGPPGATIGITAAMIEAAVDSAGGSLGAMVDTSTNIAAAFNAAVAASYPDVLSSKKRIACLVGECAQETDWFQTTTEYGAGGNPYSPYDGRGYIQLTHSGNYAGFGVWCKTLKLLTDSNYFVDDPPELAALNWAPYTAIYYFTQVKWAGKNLFEYCDLSSTPWHDISRAINVGNPFSGTPAYAEAIRAAAIDAVYAITPDPTTPTPPTGLQDALAAWMVAHLGDFTYSQASGRRTPMTSGYTDCSALLGWLYQDLADIHIGWWTGSHSDGQQQYGTVVENGTGAPDEGGMIKGDLVFFNWSGPNVNFDHVDMYIGSNQVCGHGGPGSGPVVKTLSTRCAAAYNWRVRRYL